MLCRIRRIMDTECLEIINLLFYNEMVKELQKEIKEVEKKKRTAICGDVVSGFDDCICR